MWLLDDSPRVLDKVSRTSKLAAAAALSLTALSAGCASDGASDDDGSSDAGESTASEASGDASGDADGSSSSTDGSTSGDGDTTGDGDGDTTGGDGDGDGGPLDVNQDGVVVVGYFAQWGIYGRDYQVWDIPEAIDVVQYAFWDLNPDGTLRQPDDFADFDHHNCSETLDPMCQGGALPWTEPALEYYGNFRALKMLQEKRGTKLVLSVGGWTYSTNFSAVAADPAKRAALAADCAAFLDTYGFDGIDLDWEFPVDGGNGIAHLPEDKQNFTLLAQAIRDAIGPDKILSAAVAPNPAYADNLEGAQLAGIMSHVNIMSYDYHGSWENVTGHNAPLHAVSGDGDFNVKATAQAWMDSGFPAGQVTLGLPWYGRTWSGVSCSGQGNATSGLGCTATNAGPGTWENGVVDYQDVADNYVGADGWTYTWDDATETPTLYNAALGQFITYDNADSIAAKVAYAKSQGMLGLMVWELDADRSGDLLGEMRF